MSICYFCGNSCEGDVRAPSQIVPPPLAKDAEEVHQQYQDFSPVTLVAEQPSLEEDSEQHPLSLSASKDTVASPLLEMKIKKLEKKIIKYKLMDKWVKKWIREVIKDKTKPFRHPISRTPSPSPSLMRALEQYEDTE